jgi:hypothetical protein
MRYFFLLLLVGCSTATDIVDDDAGIVAAVDIPNASAGVTGNDLYFSVTCVSEVEEFYTLNLVFAGQVELYEYEDMVLCTPEGEQYFVPQTTIVDWQSACPAPELKITYTDQTGNLVGSLIWPLYSWCLGI